MIVVIEGCDNSGKTTLALELAKRLKGIFIKTERVPPLEPDVRDYQEILEVASNYGNGIVISDRHAAISDPIYGRIIRGGTKLRDADINRCLLAIDAFVYCRPPDPVIIGRMAERTQMHGVIQNVQELIDAYDEFFTGNYVGDHHVWRYDYTKDSVSELSGELKRCMTS